MFALEGIVNVLFLKPWAVDPLKLSKENSTQKYSPKAYRFSFTELGQRIGLGLPNGPTDIHGS